MRLFSQAPWYSYGLRIEQNGARALSDTVRKSLPMISGAAKMLQIAI